MKTIILAALCAMSLGTGFVSAAQKDTRLYEMRTYYAAPGKLDNLLARFRDHTTKLFSKHGMVNIGYWIPLENPDNKLIYVLSYPDRESRETSWKAFAADPAWQKARKDSEVDGRLVTKVDLNYMEATDYSPEIKPVISDSPRIFELRTYTSAPGKLGDLNARFRNHTTKLFSKHGMTNIGYWTLRDDQNGADNTLIYILAHKSTEAASASFKAFGSDPEWTAAKAASEASGPLTVPGGVQRVFMQATDFSPMQ